MKQTNVGLAIAALLLASCMSTHVVQVQPLPPLAPLEVSVPVPPAAAFDRVVAAIAGAGMTVGSADRQAGIVKTLGMPGPAVVAGGLAVATAQSTEYLRATILPADSGSRVLLVTTMSGRVSGTYRSEQYEEAPIVDCRAMQSPPAGFQQRCLEQLARIQERMERVAAGIRQQPAR